jgi:hypothetical protein
VGEVARDTTFKGEGQETFFPSGFEGSQAVPALPSTCSRGMFERESKAFGTLEGLHYSDILI